MIKNDYNKEPLREKIIAWVAITFVCAFFVMLLALLIGLCWRLLTNVYADSPPPTTTTTASVAVATPATYFIPATTTTSTSTSTSTTSTTTTTTLPPQGMSSEAVQTAPPTEQVIVEPVVAPRQSSSVESLIRQIWPDNLEDRALKIAYRESRYECCVRTWCCFGVFQIYWQLHRSWLAEMGITDVSQLYNPSLNIKAAYALYQRAGWSPWQT